MIEFVYARYLGLLSAVAISSMIVSGCQLFVSEASEIQVEIIAGRLSDAVTNALHSTSQIFEVIVDLDGGGSGESRILLNESKFIIEDGNRRIIHFFQCRVSILPNECENLFFTTSGMIIKVQSERDIPGMDPSISIKLITF